MIGVGSYWPGEYRANAACYNCWTYTRGGGSFIGFYNLVDVAQVRRTGPQSYVAGTCS